MDDQDSVYVRHLYSVEINPNKPIIPALDLFVLNEEHKVEKKAQKGELMSFMKKFYSKEYDEEIIQKRVCRVKILA